MRLLSLTTAGLLIPDGAYALHAGGRPHDTVLVTGPPASGKTAFLRVVAAAKEAVAPYGPPPDLTDLLAAGRESGQLRATWLLSEEEARKTKGNPGERSAVIDIARGASVVVQDPEIRDALVPFAEASTRFELFPHHRRLGVESWRYPCPPLSKALVDGARLGSEPEKYGVLRRVLHDLVLAQAGSVARVLDARGVALRREQPDRLAAYKHAVASLLPDLRLIAVDTREGTAAPRFKRRDGRELELPGLSASEEQAVLFAFTYAWLGLSRSVVLVDSPELHQHPSEQAAFFHRLLRLGTDNQTIAATVSPEILGRVPGVHVIDLASRPEAKR
ncbi:MAG: hypothetical protein U0441_27715 [Polyangiaceae bacterium]